LRFRTRALQRRYENLDEAVRTWGADVGQRYVERLHTIESLDLVQDLYAVRPLDFHALRGSRRGQYAARITGQVRLILTVEDHRTVVIEEVTDYHG
jgi:plasmid maintenance system killer protein